MPSQDAVVEAIVRAVRKHLSFEHYRVFLFGSRSSGGADNRSDYDVGIDAGTPIPPESRARIADALEEIPILQKIDFVDFGSVSEDFARRAKESVKILHEQ